MLDLVFLTCFVIVVGAIWVFSNIVKTANCLERNLREISSILVGMSANIDDLDKQIREFKAQMEIEK